MRSRLLLWAALAAFAIDQISKYLVVHAMRVAEQPGGIDVLPPLLVFKYGENGHQFRPVPRELGGRALDSDRSFVAICVGVLVWLSRAAPSRLMLFCGGLLVGGALANVVDRVLYGYVLDFLNMSCCGINNPFVFNLADVFIFAGAIGLVLFDGKKAS